MNDTSKGPGSDESDVRYVLILFGGNAVSYNAASAFRESPYRPVSFVPSNSSRLYRFSDRFFRFETSRQPWSSPGYTEELISFVRSLGASRPVLTFLTSDQAVHYWIAHRTELAPHLTPVPADLASFYNKREFFRELERQGVDHPAVCDLNGSRPASLPVVVKPAYKDESGRFLRTFGAKALVAHRPEELDRFRDFDPEELICQEYVDFEMGDEYSWWGYRSPDGEVLSFAANHRRKFPDKKGRVTHVRLTDEPTVKSLGDRIVTELDYRGIADIQFIHNRRGNRFEVIEMNPRLWCSHELLLMAGVNLPRRCADDYYEAVATDPELAGPPVPTGEIDWYSVLHRLDRERLRSGACTEHFEWRKDTLLTRLGLRAYYLAKLAYYRWTRRV